MTWPFPKWSMLFIILAQNAISMSWFNWRFLVASVPVYGNSVKVFYSMGTKCHGLTRVDMFVDNFIRKFQIIPNIT